MSDQPPQGFGFIFGGPPPDEEHQRLAITAIDVMRKAVEEQARMYEEQAAVAHKWNEQLGREDVTVEACLAGELRNSLAGRTAGRLSKNMERFDPYLAHEYKAKSCEHRAAFERWQATLGKITNLEHTHAPEPPERPDGNNGEEPHTPLPTWLK